MNQDFDIREALPDDIPFIYSTFLKSYKLDSQIGKNVRDGIFFNYYKIVVDDILYHSKVLVACDKNNPLIIYSYLIFENECIHYAFTKEAFRRLGILKALYSKATTISPEFQWITHKTSYSTKLNLKMSYNPFMLYAALNQQTEK